ncbi:hypothetical protein CHLNCDRAFT_137085 [Chlorella variabilis]|uniref:Nascent polypeptide-associated complex subunit alpha-like UBA domain-containing protein n=1 Tax=Chlorella variabilis TaxID=554065 RepID=E1ZLY9_CHLVA|nr:hypothetical protein CHLNCDRAFT_137085 [Chlorella variabilis]EFN53351.1 hypothetical protein CHLNCDRAFT_137085 [Chlorella variabilis]|eukprot:XP_005845453.1 hypothetical protein CHLNCDRAFT_137085 [Chlorella variabilis]
MTEEGSEAEKPRTREAGETAAALDKVTDFREEKEMMTNVDKELVQQAMQKLAAEQAQRTEAQRQRERELAAVKVQKEDIEVIAQQFDMDKKKAERALRENGGELKTALQSLLKPLHGSSSAGTAQQPAAPQSEVAVPGAKPSRFQERRQAWRQRIEAIKAKQASRAAAGGSSDGAAAAAGGTRVYSKHIAIPIPIGGRAGGSAGATPQGSPARREPLLDAIAASLPQLEAPPVWQGFQTSEAPADMAAATDEQLQRFLHQAGWAQEAVWSLADREALVLAARVSRGAWEVERVIVACVWPEEVLRVPRKCGDPSALRAAYRRVSMAVHPDKCGAAGASDAMSIVADCYAMLVHAASGGKAAAAVPAYLRQHHPTLAMHTSSSTTSLPQPEQPQPVRRTSSFGARTPARRHSSSSHEHWHPPSRMYSEDDLQAAEASGCSPGEGRATACCGGHVEPEPE